MTTPENTKRTRERSRGLPHNVPRGPWQHLDASELDAVPIGTRRTVSLGGIWLTIHRVPEGWTIAKRHRVSSVALAGHMSVATESTTPPEQ